MHDSNLKQIFKTQTIILFKYSLSKRRCQSLKKIVFVYLMSSPGIHGFPQKMLANFSSHNEQIYMSALK